MGRPDEFPQQQQKHQPGVEDAMTPEPEVIRKTYKGSEKLNGKVALITGGDSGIGRSVAVHFAREKADVAIIYLPREKVDAEKTKEMVEAEGQKCLLLEGDVKDEIFCENAINKTISFLGSLNILVNNAGVQFPQDEVTEVNNEQFRETFKVNIFPFHYFTSEALKHMKSGDVIINTTSITAFRGSSHLVDYASTKGAILSYSRSLAKNLAGKGIRVNTVAPGPIWTPLIPSSFDKVEKFGQKAAMGRAGQPSEVAPAYVFLASEDGSYITGQVIHVNGGEFIGA
jgi:NAD(P)-dependent dehydrogenase (short-subunit alcohol dehydrogenase family)